MTSQYGEHHAAALARRLERAPEDDGALGDLAELAAFIGKESAALQLASTALRMAPGRSAHHVRLAHVYLTRAANEMAEDLREDAAESLKQSISYASNAFQLGDRNAGVVIDSATKWLQAGNLEAALAGFQVALLIDPRSATARSGLGVTQKALGQIDDAIQCYKQAIELDSEQVEPFVNLGNALREQGHFEESMAYYDRAVQVDPQYAEAHNNRGLALDACQRSVEAETSYLRAIRLDPASANCLNNLALHYTDRNEYCLAERFFRLALQQSPDHAAIHNNLAKCYKDQEKLQQAREQYGRVVKLVPEQPLLRLRQASLWPRVFADVGQMRTAEARLGNEIQRLAGHNDPLSLDDLINFADKPPCGLQFSDLNVRPLKDAYADLFTRRIQQPELPGRLDRPQLGMVVTRNHEGIFLRSLRGVLERLPMEGYDVTILADPAANERIRHSIRNERIRVIGIPSRMSELQQLLVESRFDVLYYWEIGTDMLNYFLPFFRFAPVQCTSWGVQVTSGIPSVDYYLSSRLVEPDDAETHYREQLLLSETLLTYQYRVGNETIDVKRSQWSLEASDHAYISAQHAGKLHPDFDALVIEILRRDPRGVFVTTVNPESHAAEVYRQRISAKAPDLMSRIRLLPRLSKSEYYQMLSVADVLLDPPHFGGVNSTYDGLSLGKPVVTTPSPFHRGRYTAACLGKLGIEECIAESGEDYVETAVRLGTDADYRRVVSRAIARRRSDLFEDESAVSAHESLFQQLIEQARQ